MNSCITSNLWVIYLYPENKGGYIDEDGYGSFRVFNILPGFSPGNVVISVY